MSDETTAVAKQGPSQTTLTDFLEQHKPAIASALPEHFSPDRMLRIAMSSARKNPDLLKCTSESFLGAVIQSAQLGLEPDTPLGHAYLIPYNNNKTGKKEVNFMPGYRGLMDLVYRVANHPILMPSAVYEGDVFEYSLGLHPKCAHSPMPRAKNAKLTHAYCTASWADGRREFMVLTRDEIEAVRARSKATGFTPWKTDYEAMCLKTVIRRLSKYLPMSAELQRAIGLSDLADAGETQHNDDWIKEGRPIYTKAERVQEKMSGGDPDDFENFSG